MYIKEHKRPFHVTEWLLYSVDSRVLGMYIVNLIFILITMVIVPAIIGFPVFLDVVFFVMLIGDFSLYQRMLVFEATLWNPEFCKKFPKIVQ